jgi:RNA polymerase sigma-32 factor
METNTDSATTRYVNKVRAMPIPSRERELELCLRWRDHRDQLARDEILRANLRVVVTIALKYRAYGIPLGDLIAEGNLGILHALDKFEPERGLRFVTYAAYWIRAYILNSVIQSRTLVSSGSTSMRKMFFRLRRERARIVSLLGEGEQVLDLLAAKFETSRDKVAEMLGRLESKDVSLDIGHVRDGRVPLVETLAAEGCNQEQSYANFQDVQLAHGLVDSAMGWLDPRERFIVEHHLMKDDDETLSLAELGRQLGVSRERARQLEEQAKKKLRQHMADSVGRSSMTTSLLGSAA